MQKFMPRSCVGICRNKRTRSTPLDQKLMFFLCFVVFGCILDHSVTAWNSMQNGLNWCNHCKSSCHEVISELFAKNAPDPPQWTLNSCFVAFRSVWVHLGPFHYCMKLDAKWPKFGQLMQKFGPRSRVEFFAVSAPDWTQGTVNSWFGAFHSVQVHLGLSYYGSKTRCKMGWTGAFSPKVRATKSRRNFSQRAHPN